MTDAEQAMITAALEERMARLELIVDQALANANAIEQATLEIANSMLATARDSNAIAKGSLKTLVETLDTLKRMMPEQPPPMPPQIM